MVKIIPLTNNILLANQRLTKASQRLTKASECSKEYVKTTFMFVQHGLPFFHALLYYKANTACIRTLVYYQVLCS